MNLEKLAYSLVEQCEELEYLRAENAKLRERVAKYEQQSSDELNFWQNTYGNILGKLIDEAETK